MSHGASALERRARDVGFGRRPERRGVTLDLSLDPSEVTNRGKAQLPDGGDVLCSARFDGESAGLHDQTPRISCRHDLGVGHVLSIGPTSRPGYAP
jgi:hypothetical protein